MTVDRLPRDIRQRLRLERWDHAKAAPLLRYMDEFGEESLRTMLDESDRRHRCCWAPVAGPHSVGCPDAVEEDVQQTQDEGLF